jgi:hypothetical protein
MIRVESRPLAAALQNAALIRGGKDVEPSGTWLVVGPEWLSLVTVNRIMGIQHTFLPEQYAGGKDEVLPLTLEEVKRLQKLTAGASATISITFTGHTWQWVSSRGSGEEGYSSKADQERPKAVYTAAAHAGDEPRLLAQWQAMIETYPPPDDGCTCPLCQRSVVLATSVLNVVSRLKADKGRIRVTYPINPDEPVVVRTGQTVAIFATAEPAGEV